MMAGHDPPIIYGLAGLMPFSPSSEPALPAAWTDALERIQRVLAEAMHAADARAQALEKSVVDESSRARSVSEGIPSLAHASGSAHQYDGLATEIEESLASAQEALDRWLARAAET